MVVVFQQVHCRFGGLFCEFHLLSGHTAGPVQNDHHANRTRFVFLGVECHRQHFFDGGFGISALAVTVLSAGQDEPAAQIADISSDRLHLRVGQPFPVDITEDDRIVGVQHGQVRRHRLRINGIHQESFDAERLSKISSAWRVTFNIEDARPAQDGGGFVKDVVLDEWLVRHLHVSFQHGRACFTFDRSLESHAVQAFRQMNGPFGQDLIAVFNFDFRC